MPILKFTKKDNDIIISEQAADGNGILTKTFNFKTKQVTTVLTKTESFSAQSKKEIEQARKQLAIMAASPSKKKNPTTAAETTVTCWSH